MRRRIVAVIVLATVGNLGARAEDGPAGTWKVRTSFGGRGGRAAILRLRTEDDKLSGDLFLHQGSKTALTNLRFADGEISFEVARRWDGRSFTTKYFGVIKDDVIKGTAEFQRRGGQRTLDWEATRTTPRELSKDVDLPPVAADIDLNEENYDVWREHILPDASEMVWTQIPWLTTFKDGILSANTSGKPLLLWTMNGHPLGCT